MRAENILVNIPKLRETANPFIVPVPSQNKTKAALNVVRFASSIVMKARLNPLFTDEIKFKPSLLSSLMRSNIMMLASTAIPIDSISPAMPGSVKVAPRSLKVASVINI